MIKKLRQLTEGIRHGLPNMVRPWLPLSKRGKEWLAALRADGVVRINKPEFDEAADALGKLHFRLFRERGMPEKLEGGDLGGEGLFAVKFPGEYGQALEEAGAGAEDFYHVSLKDPVIGRVALDLEILTLLYNYYRRQPYFRNQPFLSRILIEKTIPLEVSPAIFHMDHVRQVTGMLLVSDTGLKTTHMEYVRGSHDRRFWRRNDLGPSQCAAAARAAGPRGIVPLVGPAGTFYLFDAGGIHRRVHHPGSERRILHFNMTTGHNMRKGLEGFQDWQRHGSRPALVRRAVSRL